MLREKNGHKGMRGIVEKGKWLMVVLDEKLDFGPHW